MKQILKKLFVGIVLVLTTVLPYVLNGSQCCLTSACGALPTVDTVPGAIAVSSKGCLSLIQTNSKIASYKITENSCCLTPCCDVVFPVTCTGPIICGQQAPSQQALAYSPDGKCLVAIDSGSNNLSIFGVKNDCCLSKQKSLKVNLPSTVAFSPNSCCLFVGEQDSQIAAYTVSKCNARFKSFTGQNTFFSPKFAMSSNGCLAVIDSGTLYLFCSNTCDDCALCCKPTAQIQISGWNPTSAAFSPDGGCLAVTSANYVYTFCIQGCHVIPGPEGTINCSLFGNGIGLQPVQAVFSPSQISSGIWCLAVAYQSSTGTGNGLVTLFEVVF